MSKVIVHLEGGRSYETTEHALPNIERMLVGQITGIERPGQDVGDLTNSIDDKLVVEIDNVVIEEIVDSEDVRFPTLKELKSSDKDVLKQMANDIAERKGITKVNGRSGVEKLSEWIMEHQED